MWGEYACFTRPEFGVERVSYDVMTPSAARGILSAIFWKPEFDWSVREIHILKPVRFMSVQRNEVHAVQSEFTARRWAETGEGNYYANRDTTQRHSTFLRDVAYLIVADVSLRPYMRSHVAQYRDQFRRRVNRGQSFTTPYLGTRECSAFFGPANPDDFPINLNRRLGMMLFDLRFTADLAGPIAYRQHGRTGSRITKGRAEPVFFPAEVERGILKVPDLYHLTRPREVECK